MKIKILFLTASILMLGSVYGSPVWADTRTATIHVSCTIVPMIEMSSFSSSAIPAAGHSSSEQTAAVPERTLLGLTSAGAKVQVNTNLGKNFGVSESVRVANGSSTKIYSVTAL